MVSPPYFGSLPIHTKAVYAFVNCRQGLFVQLYHIKWFFFRAQTRDGNLLLMEICKRGLSRWDQQYSPHYVLWQGDVINVFDGPNLASFCLFLFFLNDKYSTNLTINDKSIDGVLGTRTHVEGW